MSTQEQRTDRDWFTATVRDAMPNARVTEDTEGWPIVQGRTGRLESGADAATLWLYTDRPVMIGRLRTLPGLRLYQVGDREARFRVETPDRSTVGTILSTIGARRVRQYTPEQKMALAERLAEGRATRAQKES